MGETRLMAEPGLPASNSQLLFQLLEFKDLNGDGVIRGEDEGFVSKADINYDNKIDIHEAKYYLATLDFPRAIRHNFSLNHEDIDTLRSYFDLRRTCIEYTEEESLRNQDLLQTAAYMLSSGYTEFQEPAFSILDTMPETMADEIAQTSYLTYYHDTYEECRAAFLAKIDTLAKQRPDLSRLNIPVSSQTTDDLSVDGVFIPATGEQKHCLVLISGTHGVEGFFGNAQQLYLLDQIIKGKVDLTHVGIMMVHGYNPWGFKTEMRPMEDGVDANRNNLYHTTHMELENPFYHELNPFVNPRGPFSEDAWWRQGFMAKSVARLLYYGKGNPTAGRTKVRQALLQGQNDYRGGISDAGSDYADQLSPLVEFYKAHTANYDEVVLMDVHTGLGDYAHVHYLSVDPNTTPEQEDRLSALFGNVTFTDEESDEFYTIGGDLIGYLQSQSPEEQFTLCIAPEAGTVGLGTVNQINSLRTLIGMNQCLREGAETAKDELVVRKEILRFLNPRHPNWRGPIMMQAAERLNNMFSVWAAEDNE